jgi:hypothetical protein
MSHDSDHDDLVHGDSSLRTQLALVKRDVRAIRSIGAWIAGALLGLVAVGAAALVMIGSYKERVDQLDNRVTRIEARPYLANTHRSDSP